MLPFARSIRAMPAVMPSRSRNETGGGLASILNSLRNQGIGRPAFDRLATPSRISEAMAGPTDMRFQPAMSYDQAIARSRQRDMKRPEEQAQIDAAIAAGPMQMTGEARRPANPFEGNEQYQALMEFQQSLAPNQEQQTRLQELRSAFEGTGAYKDYQINQMQQQMRQMQQRPQMGMGLGSMRPMGMQPYQGFGRPQFPMQMPMQQPMRQLGAMGYNQPQPYQQQPMMGGYGMSPYQQMRPQPQQFGGYGMGQSMGGYGGYGGMSNPYQPQQFGYNPNNSMGYGQQQMNQFQGYMR